MKITEIVSEDISRRNILKGIGATAAAGAAAPASALWQQVDEPDRLTGGKKSKLENTSIENPAIKLLVNRWAPLNKFVAVLTGLPKININVTHRIENIGGQLLPFRIVIDNQLMDNVNGLLIPSSSSTMLLIALEGGPNKELYGKIVDSIEGEHNIKIEVYNDVYTFTGLRLPRANR